MFSFFLLPSPIHPLQMLVMNPYYKENCDRDSLVVTDSWMACLEFEPSTAEDPLCRGVRCTLNTSRLKRPPVDVVWYFGERWPDMVPSSSLDNSHRVALKSGVNKHPPLV
ncbi:hypothetical protein TNCV_2629371 [Trichonephila clavipes]|uniref:Uncharacterized protein n=1 Tax=Trichonephila clavipes TaxID=2585209 RepID=A0A8X6SF10_TRICX|nr:hypothetical protein TNCV_2629371 [Trichonephila clavipes]